MVTLSLGAGSKLAISNSWFGGWLENVKNLPTAAQMLPGGIHVFWKFLWTQQVAQKKILPSPVVLPMPLISQDAVANVLATSVYGLQRVIEIMDGSGLVLTDEEAAEASNSLELHLKSYMWLAVFFYERRVMYFKVRCKTHYLFHVAVEIRLWKLNPTIWENFEEEAFLGKLKRIAIRCHGGTCTQRMFFRYLLCLAMALREFQKTASLWEWTTSTVNLLGVLACELNCEICSSRYVFPTLQTCSLNSGWLSKILVFGEISCNSSGKQKPDCKRGGVPHGLGSRSSMAANRAVRPKLKCCFSIAFGFNPVGSWSLLSLNPLKPFWALWKAFVGSWNQFQGIISGDMRCCVLSHLWLSEGRAHQLAPHSFWGMVLSKHQKYRGWSVEPATRKMPYLIPIDPLGKDFEHTYNMYKENVYAQICPFSKFMCFKLIYITYMHTCEYKLIYYIYK